MPASLDLARILQYYLAVWHKDDIVLVGYSLGADVVPALANRLPHELLNRVRVIALLTPALAAQFEFHLSDWLRAHTRDLSAQPIFPELLKLRSRQILCFYGKEEENASVCPLIPPNVGTTIALQGGYHFDGAYDVLARRLLAEITTARGSDHEKPPSSRGMPNL
ncbi:MAG: AcvB/VirJ family lysyl-phosphatidylglycerol hydrolase [Candidatus Binatia bacterium]